MFIQFDSKQNTGLITLNRPEVHNAMNTQMLIELEACIDKIKDDAQLHCLIITGAGAAFTTGEDVNELCEMSQEQAKEYSTLGLRVMQKIEQLPMPVIAAVNGWALGGGCELALACDIRVAAETAIFSFPEASLGITTGLGGTSRLIRTIGEGRAKHLIYTGSRIRGPEALQIGLVTQISPLKYLMEEVCDMANNIAANSTFAVRLAKQLFLDMPEEPVACDRIQAEAFSQCFDREEQKQHMKEFLED